LPFGTPHFEHMKLFGHMPFVTLAAFETSQFSELWRFVAMALRSCLNTNMKYVILLLPAVDP
jgi:hypothetical protein